MSLRFVIVMLATLASLIQVAQRYNMSIAIIAMVNNTAFIVTESNTSDNKNSVCPAEIVNRTQEFPEGKHLWTPSQQGIILSAYFYGYTATQIVGGRWAERWGGKIICGTGVLFASVSTLLIPFTANYFSLIIILRVLVDAFHGFIYSSLYSVFNIWVSDRERATAIGGMMAGGTLGGAIALPLVSYLCSSPHFGGWQSSFYIIAAFGFIWSIVWFIFMTDLPEKHSKITEKELNFINGSIKSQSVKTKTIPWTKMMCSKAVLASVVAKTTGSFAYFVMTTELPLYLEHVLNIPIKNNGFFNSYSYLVLTFSLYFSGRIADYIKTKNVVSTTLLRKIFQAIAMFGQILLALIPFAGCDKRCVIACILLSMFIYGFLSGGELSIVPEFAPKYSATVYGFSNFFAGIAGILAPVFVGVLLNENIHDREKWNIVFNTCAGLSTFGLIFFSAFARAVPTKWA